MFSDRDLEQFNSLNIKTEFIEKQLQYFRTGFPAIRLDRPATPGDGIIRFDEPGRKRFIQYFDDQCQTVSMIKFVPASGAASRMFKSLFEFREKFVGKTADVENDLTDKGLEPVRSFFENLENFAFYDDLKKVISADGTSPDELLAGKDPGRIVSYLLSDSGLGYSNLPKALLKFHSYPDGSRVAFEEHLVEAALYANDGKGSARIHFTLSPEHIGKFHARLKEVLPGYEKKFGLNFRIEHSVQEKSTDTIAVDTGNNPFRTDSGELLFRPGGHGALIPNLNSIDADIVFIKNIDNIVPDRLKGHTVEYKKLIGGYLLYIREYIFNFLKKNDQKTLTETDLQEMFTFLKENLFMQLPDQTGALSFIEKQNLLLNLVNRPIRVCGMVKNEGEPGGGPFWVSDSAGEQTLQIVESSQVDQANEDQVRILHSSTHFNPVDLVCSVRSYNGKAFDLSEFIDPDTGFIAEKSFGGKVIKAQELPGLWNGAMAKWITVFVDVPLITFNPVKTVNDLLRKEHQP